MHNTICKLTHDERKNWLTENLACEQYLSQFGALAGVSAAKSNKFFKAKHIRDDLMFNKEVSDGEEEVVKATNNILNHLKSIEISWTANQRCWKENIPERISTRTFYSVNVSNMGVLSHQLQKFEILSRRHMITRS